MASLCWASRTFGETGRLQGRGSPTSSSLGLRVRQLVGIALRLAMAMGSEGLATPPLQAIVMLVLFANIRGPEIACVVQHDATHDAMNNDDTMLLNSCCVMQCGVAPTVVVV